MNTEKNQIYSTIVLIGAALYGTITYYFIPEITKGAYDVAASIWFVFSPLYLWVKRIWMIKKLSKPIQVPIDITCALVVNCCLGWTATQSMSPLLNRVLIVWLLCVVIWVIILRTKTIESEQNEDNKE